ncbi:hypothetical protein HB771_22320 [Rhizobium leguminosarum bv. viciae]|nr:hypothetical protein HB771_22320 [Rhizobium leguminosarum bv. viciae]
MTSAEQVGSFLLDLDDRKFWDLHVFPEIAELRATRFGDLDQKTKETIVERILKGPPRNHWPKKAEAAKVKNARLYWAVRELKRIEIAGSQLPASSKSWLDTRIAQFADLEAITIDEGFPEGATVRSVPRNPDDRYNTLEGAPGCARSRRRYQRAAVVGTTTPLNGRTIGCKNLKRPHLSSEISKPQGMAEMTSPESGTVSVGHILRGRQNPSGRHHAIFKARQPES